MTRKQAEKVAAEVVKLAWVAGKDDSQWTRVEFDMPPALAAKIDEAPGFVTGCLPMGWRISGASGSSRLTVLRQG